MTRTLVALAVLGFLASCAQYQEPQANCFTFLAAVAPVDPNCNFTPLGTLEGDIAV
ncbi:hypothetical protein [Pelagimonas varians]|uniref:Lipoprotein n=1 Tax=Pelagimonas varians TaxID=696760 RepID=A0A238L1K3_9RHOB|nr:hypothetical protein [Pelagimonas varians]PYG27346.1 hypothetical protein C8N36_11619 [Pelagimonas varians]SMX48312.1 hypothetical protein PEV8663_03809 [Pelagimonas varians]